MKALLLLSVFLILPFFNFAQENGGPYLVDNQTSLLMHFEGDLSNAASVGFDGISHGNGVSYDNDGVHGKCLRLDNSTWDKQSWIEVPFFDELNASEDGLAVECWFKINSWGETTSGTRYLFRKDGASWIADYEIILWPEVNEGRHGQVNLDCVDEETRNWGADAPIADILELDTWYYVVIYYNPQFIHEYVNDEGEQRQASSVYCLIRNENFEEIFASRGHTEAVPTNSEGLFRLGFGGGDESYFDGWIDELRISNSYRSYRDDVLANVDVEAFPDSVFIPLNDTWTVFQWPLAEYYPIDPETGDIYRQNACGPTMLARGIHYWEYPRFPEGEIEHDWDGLDWYANYGESEYLWDQIPHVFSLDVTEEEYEPAAMFSAQVGVASWKSFNGMYCMPKFLKENFLFSKRTRIVFEEEYSKKDWEDIIRNELANGRICMVGGWGHYYIINAYNSKGEFYTDNSFNDILWNDIEDFDFGDMQDMIIYFEPDWGDKELELLSPVSGNMLKNGSSIEIQWIAQNINQLILEYSSDAGYTWQTIADDVDANAGTYSWTLPDAVAEDFRIRISDKDDLNIYRKCKKLNVYDHKEFIFNYPNQTTRFLKGTEQTIYWQSSGIEAVKIEYSLDGTNWTLLSEETNAMSGYLQIPLPDVFSDQIVLRATELADGGIIAQSEAFSLIDESFIGGPYQADDETFLLMHFENNILNSANNQLLPYETNPIGYYEANYKNSLGKAFRNINGDITGNIFIVKNSETIDLGNDWTMEAWVNITSVMGERTVVSLIISKWDAFNINAGGQHFGGAVFLENGTEIAFYNPDEYELDKWYHVAMISDASTEKFYFFIHDDDLDLVYQEEKDFPAGSNGMIRENEDFLVTLGGLGQYANMELDGFVDEIRILGRSELSAYTENILDEYAVLPFNDDFSNEYENWNTISVSGEDQWHISGDDGIDGSKCPRFYNYASTEDNDDWLVSPVFNTVGIESLSLTFKYTYNVDGVVPDFYYASTFDGDPANSDWTQIDKDFWTSEWDWQDASIEIENPGETFVFALRYQPSSGTAFWFLMDNFIVQEYLPPPTYNLVGSTEHFEFYTNLAGEADFFETIKDTLEAAFQKYGDIWNVGGKSDFMDQTEKTGVYFADKDNIDLVSNDAPEIKSGFFDRQTKTIYLSPLNTSDKVAYYQNLEGLAINTFAAYAKKYQLFRDRGWDEQPSYFLEGFGLYEQGFRPRHDSILSYRSQHPGVLNHEDLEKMDIFRNTSERDVILSYVEAQIVCLLDYYCEAPYSSFIPIWNNYFVHFHDTTDDVRIQKYASNKHFDIYCSSRDTMFIDSFFVWLERPRQFYIDSFQLDIQRRYNLVIYYDKKTGMDMTGYDDWNGGSGGLNISPHKFNGGVKDFGWLLAHEFGHVFNSLMYSEMPFGFYHEGMANFSGFKLYGNDWMESRWMIKNVFNTYQNNHGRPPTLDEFAYNPENNIDPYFFGLAFIRYLSSFNALTTIRDFFRDGLDYTVFGETKEDIEAGYIDYLTSVSNDVVDIKLNDQIKIIQHHSGLFVKTTDTELKINKVELFDALGRKLCYKKAGKQNEIKMDIPSGLKKQLCILRIYSNKGTSVQRILVHVE